ncbi:hypothetical protein EI94DRAFT_1744591, partial [Lactarius quietus]
ARRVGQPRHRDWGAQSFLCLSVVGSRSPGGSAGATLPPYAPSPPPCPQSGAVPLHPFASTLRVKERGQRRGARRDGEALCPTNPVCARLGWRVRSPGGARHVPQRPGLGAKGTGEGRAVPWRMPGEGWRGAPMGRGGCGCAQSLPAPPAPPG